MTSVSLPANVVQPQSLCNKVGKVVTHPATQTVTSGISLGGSVSVGMLMLSGTIAVNAIPIVGQGICIALVVIWIIASLYSYFKGVSRWDDLDKEKNRLAYAKVEILHPPPVKVEPSEVELMPFKTTTVGEEDDSGRHPYVPDDVDAPGSVELMPVNAKSHTHMRRLPMGVLTFAEMHESIGREIARKTQQAAQVSEVDPGTTPDEEETEQPGLVQTGLVPPLKVESVIIEDVTDQPLTDRREPLHFPHSQVRTPPHLSLVPYQFPQPSKIEEVETPRSDWMLVPLSSPLAPKGPKVEEITQEEYIRLKDRETVRQVFEERAARKGQAQPRPKRLAIEGPSIPVNPETLRMRKILADAAKARQARSQVSPYNLRLRTNRKRQASESLDTTVAPSTSRRRLAHTTLRLRENSTALTKPASRWAGVQEYAWKKLEQGQALVESGLNRLPTWMFQRVEPSAVDVVF